MRKLTTARTLATTLKKQRESEREREREGGEGGREIIILVFEPLWRVEVRHNRPMMLRTSVNALSSAFDQFQVDARNSEDLDSARLGANFDKIPNGFSFSEEDLNLE